MMDSKTLSAFKKYLQTCFGNIAARFPQATDIIGKEISYLGTNVSRYVCNQKRKKVKKMK